MSVNPWYIPGSLRNLPPVAGKVPGFRFVYRLSWGKTYLYAMHSMTITVDGKDLSAGLSLRRNGVTARASGLAATDWVAFTGDAYEFLVELPGGLAPGAHHINVKVVSGGNYSGRTAPGEPLELLDFTAEIR